MNDFIKSDDFGIELGSGPGFTKEFINNRNFKISDLSNHDHLDYKNVDAQATQFKNETFDFVIASNMIHHIPYPVKFFKEVNRILKKSRSSQRLKNIFWLWYINKNYNKFNFLKNLISIICISVNSIKKYGFK